MSHIHWDELRNLREYVAEGLLLDHIRIVVPPRLGRHSIPFVFLLSNIILWPSFMYMCMRILYIYTIRFHTISMRIERLKSNRMNIISCDKPLILINKICVFCGNNYSVNSFNDDNSQCFI